MPYRTLLVHLDGDARCAARVDFALQLAARHGARLLGLAATGDTALPVALEANVHAWRVVVESAREQRRAAAAGWLQAFEAQARAAGHADHEALRCDEPAEQALVRHGRLSDLLVLSQVDPHDAGASAPADLPQRVFMQTGRPVLLVPRARALKTVGQRVMVAWSGTRESARALADAMPLLQAAEAVQVLCLDRPDEALVSRLALNDLHHWLQRHGVQAECVQASTTEDVGETLLLRAVGFAADLIVMGGYGHARWSQLTLGGVTRTLTATAVVPLLISH